MAGAEEEKLFLKRYTCPVCDNEFKALTVKSGKARMIRTEMDLRNIYEDIDPLKYDIILCPKCGYAALARFFPNITSVQQNYISEKITPNFKPLVEGEKEYTYEEALARYHVAFANTVAKMAKASELAYLAIKTAWLCRGYQENIKPNIPGAEQKRKQLEKLEQDNLKRSYDMWTQAVAKENFPMCGMDEATVDYLLAVLSMKFGNYYDAAKLFSKVITSYSAGERLKDKARDAKEELSRLMKEAQEKAGAETE